MLRRDFLRLCTVGIAGAPLLSRADQAAEDTFLEALQRNSYRYFEEQSDGGTGLVLDRGCTNGSLYTIDARPTASTSVTGFGLAAHCIAAERRWIPRAEALRRVRTTLRFLAADAPHERGWFYHWLHRSTGKRAGAFATGRGAAGVSEVSTIDTALLLAGVLTARQYFSDQPDVVSAADLVYRRIDFPWMLDRGTGLLRHGWTPEKGFIPYSWDQYSEASILYLLALASPTHPIPPASWYAWKRNPNRYGAYAYVGVAPLFTVQYSHAFFDFRGRQERTGIDWFENSRTATRAHRQFCIDLHPRFMGYNEDIWGITASRSVTGYTDWGGPPRDPRIDGTVVPCAAGGSIMFEPELCRRALLEMDSCFGSTISCRYGFTDSFNPNTGWVSPDVTGLNLGITLLAVENHRSGNLWRWFMSAAEARRALELAAFSPRQV